MIGSHDEPAPRAGRSIRWSSRRPTLSCAAQSGVENSLQGSWHARAEVIGCMLAANGEDMSGFSSSEEIATSACFCRLSGNVLFDGSVRHARIPRVSTRGVTALSQLVFMPYHEDEHLLLMVASQDDVSLTTIERYLNVIWFLKLFIYNYINAF